MQMVNAGFPERMRYGFEMVDGREHPCSRGKLPSIKYLQQTQ
jgi:hypothetical protein